MSKFTLAQLEAFDAICRLGTFHAAASALHVTQPTITLRIRELEAAVGAQLFDRRGRTARLSAEGAVVAQYVAQGLLLLREMQAQVKSGDPLQGSLRLGSNEMVAVTCLPQIIQMLEATYPGLKVEMTVATSYALTELLDGNKLDVAILADAQPRPHLALQALARAEVAWVGGAQRPLARGLLRTQDLEGAKVVTVPPPSTLNRMIHDWFGSQRMPSPPVSTCNSIVIIAQLVAANVATSILPVCLLHEEIRLGRVIRYRHTGDIAPLEIAAAYRKNIRTSSVDAVLRVTRDVMQRSGLFQAMRPGKAAARSA